MSDPRTELLGLLRQDPERPFLLEPRDGSEWTRGAFDAGARALAAHLRDRLGPGDVLAVALDNAVSTALVYVAGMHLGARLVPINTAFHPEHVAELLALVEPKLTLVSPRVLVRCREQGVALPTGDALACVSPAPERLKAAHQDLVDLDPLAVARAGGQLDGDPGAEGPHDFLTVLSSGTTGKPKGIPFSYARVLESARGFTHVLGIGLDHRFYDVLPMTYLGGLYNLFLLPLVAGGSVVVDAVFGPKTIYGFWSRVRETGINTLWFNPTMLTQLLSLDDDEDLSFLRDQVRLGLCGMADLAPDLKQRFEDRFGFTLHENYGLAETTFLTTSTPDHPAAAGSVGAPLPGVTLEILDEHRRPVPVGHVGQIAAKTPFLASGYEFAGETERVNFLADGRLLTGDVGRLDAAGHLHLSGRVKDVIIRGGLNIHPAALETVVHALEGVEEVAVVGLPDPVYGEEVALVVKPRAGSGLTREALRDHSRAHLADYQRPRHVFFIDDFPKSVSGKIQKPVLRRLLLQRVDPLGG